MVLPFPAPALGSALAAVPPAVTPVKQMQERTRKEEQIRERA
jgi:hypothetical protein